MLRRWLVVGSVVLSVAETCNSGIAEALLGVGG